MPLIHLTRLVLKAIKIRARDVLPKVIDSILFSVVVFGIVWFCSRVLCQNAVAMQAIIPQTNKIRLTNESEEGSLSLDCHFSIYRNQAWRSEGVEMAAVGPLPTKPYQKARVALTQLMV